MPITLPQTSSEFVILAVPMVTLLLGSVFLLLPKTALGWLGIENQPQTPEAIGEGRSSFAGFLMGTSLCCLLFQQPIAQQPGLTFMLAAGWLLAGLGKTVQLIADGSRRKRDMIYMVLAFLMGAAALTVAEPAIASPQLPQTRGDWFIALVALITTVFGLVCLLLPDRALALLRLQTTAGRQEAAGEPRAMLSGFYMSVGLANLFGLGLFAALVLGVCWAMTAFGRLVSILSDRGRSLYNGLSLVFDLAMAGLPLAVVFNLAG